MEILEEVDSSPFDGFDAADLARLQVAADERGLSIRDYILRLHNAANPQPARVELGPLPKSVLETELGTMLLGDSRRAMASVLDEASVDLVMTSPPFALVYKKDYGNEDADRYLQWFRTFLPGLKRILKPTGSLVIDIGGVWKKGRPVRSLYHFELLVMLCREAGFHLCQEFYWYNPAKLPVPAEWVNVRRIRVKDSINCVWWLSPTPYPRASNRRVLQPYSQDMKRLIKNGYRHKKRPSGHNISANFKRNNAGAIPPNLIALANNDSNSAYRRYCQDNGLVEHPAQFPRGLPAFFVRMLTDKQDLVFDPFGGSCVTGEVAEAMGRRWVTCERREDYTAAAKGRFVDLANLPDPTSQIRTDPYSVFPPTLGITPEEQAPLPADGGKKRSPKRGG